MLAENHKQAPDQTSSPPRLRRVAIIGTYPPRQCGIATFSADLLEAINQASPSTNCLAVPITDTQEGYQYPERVRFEIRQNDLVSYRYAADYLNISGVDVACLQHEFGIFGGVAGSHLLTLVKELRVPLVTTFHTILRDPNVDQRGVMEMLIASSDRLVVMSRLGAEILSDLYSAADDKIEIIPHGIPDVPFIDPIFHKGKFGLEGKSVILTFGLLSPGKGIENVILALPEITRQHPDLVFVVLGATHPNIKKQEGEAYRLSLQRLAASLGVEQHVVFYNRFVDLDELIEFISAADIYITPYLNETQTTSGTLAYAVGMGKAVISTPYWYAKEILSDDRGILIPFADPDATAEAVTQVLQNKTKTHRRRIRAYELGRDMIWPVVAGRYLDCFARIGEDRVVKPRRVSSASPLHIRPRELVQVDLQHLERLTDDTGLLQHATFIVPNYHDGYTTDDNARGLLVTTLLEASGQLVEKSRELSIRYLAFLMHAFNPSEGRFRNFMAYDRRWLEEVGSEDSHGRALWALGTVVGRAEVAAYRGMAVRIFDQALPAVEYTTSPRTWAFALLGFQEYLSHFSGDRRVGQMRNLLAERLLQAFHDSASEEWPWFENILSYANAVLPHALLISGKAMDNDEMIAGGLRTLEWLTDIQDLSNTCFSPIGSNGFYRRGGNRARFDQQPLEAQAMVSACLDAFRVTNDPAWRAKARWAFDWFFGQNDLSEPLYDPLTGSCLDGLHADRLNENRGAESTLAFLQSLTEMHAIEALVEVSDLQERNESEAIPKLAS
jgi:glycosyltransferase involved in cell wall biosynthesis